MTETYGVPKERFICLFTKSAITKEYRYVFCKKSRDTVSGAAYRCANSQCKKSFHKHHLITHDKKNHDGANVFSQRPEGVPTRSVISGEFEDMGLVGWTCRCALFYPKDKVSLTFTNRRDLQRHQNRDHQSLDIYFERKEGNFIIVSASTIEDDVLACESAYISIKQRNLSADKLLSYKTWTTWRGDHH